MNTLPNPSPWEVSPRIKAFRKDLIQQIPRIPNNKTSLLNMQAKNLRDLFVDYLNWTSRYVFPRKRDVHVDPVVQTDPRWASHQAAIQILLEKVRHGDDLTPYLSIAPKTYGVNLNAQSPSATAEDRWSDKDLVLNVMGFHHFHLGTKMEKAGHIQRTNDLIFAKVTRSCFRVVALFDHDVFKKETAERRRLHAVHEQMLTSAAGGIVLMSNIMMSGHNSDVVQHATNCIRAIREIEPKLDDPSFISDLYRDAIIEKPKKPKLIWTFRDFDLGVYDPAAHFFWIFVKGRG